MSHWNGSAAAIELSCLSRAEHLVIWTARRMVAGLDQCPLVVRELDAACGSGAGDVWAALRLALQLLGRGSRRPVLFGVPGCGALTPDERQLLLLVGAARAGQRDLLHARLLWLVRPDVREDLAFILETLGRALADRRQRREEVRPRRAGGAAPTGISKVEALSFAPCKR